MKNKLILLITVTMFIASCASQKKNDIAAVKAGDNSTKALAINDNKEKLVCKRIQKVGTHFKTKVCTTRAQREQDRINASRFTEKYEHIRTKNLVNDRSGN